MTRTNLPLIFALLIFVSHLHCVTGHGDFVQIQRDRTIRESNPRSLPLSPPVSDSCKHAGGCICEGATLATSFVIAEVDFSTFIVVDLFSIAKLNRQVPPSLAKSTTRKFFRALPVRALDRCVLQQSFSI